MSKFIRALALFIASAPLLGSKAKASEGPGPSVDPSATTEPVSLRPLNFERDNLFAGHRSHSSHRSHASHSSHYSGSGGGYYSPLPPPPPPAFVPTPAPPAYPAPAPAPAPYGSSFAPGNASAAKPTNAIPQSAGASGPPGAASAPSTLANDDAPQLTRGEKLRLQVLRVQIALKRHGLYDGPVNGVFNQETRAGLSHFQTVKSIPATGMMTTATLNALGVPAVN